MARIMAKRRAELSAARAAADADARAHEDDDAAQILHRIRDFFGLSAD
jgi:hypothetical protein